MANRHIDDSVRKEYLDWLLLPPTQREPATKEEMADYLGVSRKTLYNWEESDDFQAALRSIKGKWGVRFQGDILGRLMDVVQNGQDKDAIAAARVLLSHLDVGGDEKKKSADSERLAEIKAELEQLGFSTIDNDG